MNHENNKSGPETESMLTALEGTGANQVEWSSDFSASGAGKDDDAVIENPA